MKIFISYRRDDTRHLSALISDRLRRRYGEANVFLDSGSIKAGGEWRKQLTTELHTCDVLIAVIGDDWLEVRDNQGRRRIENPEDEVRREITTAFDRDIPVIPLLVEGAKMPERESLPEALGQLHERQWLEIRSNQYFDNDVKLLFDALQKSNHRLRTALAGSVAIVLVSTVIGLVFYLPRDTPPNPNPNPTAPTHPPLVSTPDPVGPQSEQSIVGLWEQRFFSEGAWHIGGVFRVTQPGNGMYYMVLEKTGPGIEQSSGTYDITWDGTQWTFYSSWGATKGKFELTKVTPDLYSGMSYEDGKPLFKNEFRRMRQ